eukprot:6454329-Amphidinium_carterae.2
MEVFGAICSGSLYTLLVVDYAHFESPSLSRSLARLIADLRLQVFYKGSLTVQQRFKVVGLVEKGGGKPRL